MGVLSTILKLIGIAILMIIVFGMASSLMGRRSQSPINLTPGSGSDPDAISPTGARPALRLLVEDALQQDIFEPLAEYMADPITVNVTGDDCCGSLSPDEAVAKLYLVEPETSWRFEGEQVAEIKSSDPDRLASAIVAVSSGSIVIFEVNSQDQISYITINQSLPQSERL